MRLKKWFWISKIYCRAYCTVWYQIIHIFTTNRSNNGLSELSQPKSSRLCDIIMSCLLFLGRHHKKIKKRFLLRIIWIKYRSRETFSTSYISKKMWDENYISCEKNQELRKRLSRKNNFFIEWLLFISQSGCCCVGWMFRYKTVCCYHCYPSNKQSQR